ncbi:Rz1 family lipoprotein [Salmonella enterica subsp. enterica]
MSKDAVQCQPQPQPKPPVPAAWAMLPPSNSLQLLDKTFSISAPESSAIRKTEVFAGVHPDAVQIKNSRRREKELTCGEFQKCINMTMSLGLRTTTSRFYRTDISQFSYTSKT